MRKRWGNFLQKAMAVLLSAVLCVGLAVGAEPMEVRAEEEPPSAQLRVTVLGYDGDDVNELGAVYLEEVAGTKKWIPSASIEAGVITYEVKGLRANTKYWWRLYMETSHAVIVEISTRESGVYQSSSTFISIWYKDGEMILDTDYIWRTHSQIPVPDMIPVKEGYTFAGWVTENGGNTKFNFNQKINQATSIYASWTKDPVEITQDEFSSALSNIVQNMPMTNDTTREEVEEYIKREMDEYFQIDSNISVVKFHILQEATSVYDGRLEYEVTASYETYTARSEGIRPVTDELLVQDRGWTLDEAGNLTIASPEGMEDWAQNGRLEDNNVSDVKKVVIEDGVTEIPDNAFNGCSNLGSVVVPDTVTDIGDSAFAGNSSLGEITLPSGLGSIGSGAFSGCSSLEKVVMQGETPPSVGDSVFDGCKFVEDNTGGIIVPEGSEDRYKTEWGDSLGGNIAVRQPVTEEALSRKLQEIFDSLVVSNETTPESIINRIKGIIDGYFQTGSQVTIAGFDLTAATSDSEGALKLAVIAKCGEDCTAKAEGTIPIAKLPPAPDRGWELDEVGNLTIKSQAGMDDWTQNGKSETGASVIKSVVIMEGVTAVPDNAFFSCNNLGAVTIPGTVAAIGNSAFAFNTSLPSVVLPQGLQSIGKEVFLGCDLLEKIVMQGSTPPSIGESVFDHCKFTDKDNPTGGIVVPAESVDAYKDAWGELGALITGKHTHNYTDDWKYDEVHHWHECSCGNPGNVAAHEWGNGNVIKEPTAAEEGLREYICPVCGATKTERIPATGGTPSTSGNDNPGGNKPSVSDNDNPGGNNPSVSGNDNPGGNIPSISGNDNPGGNKPSTPGGDNPGSSTPSTPSGDNPGGSTPSTPSDGSPGGSNPSAPVGGNPDQPTGDSNSEYSTLQIAHTAADTPWTPEPKTGDDASTGLYATTAMILGFTYLILLFSERHGMTEEKKKELLSRLISWARYGGKSRRMLALAGIFLLLVYYHGIGREIAKEEETGLAV